MKILAVDDSFDWLNTHTMMCMEVFGEDVKLVLANSAFEGLNIYKDEYADDPFDLVITDLQMESDFEPMYAGEWLTKEIREINSQQNILIISTAYNIELIARNYNADYLSKRTIATDPLNYKLKLKSLYN